MAIPLLTGGDFNNQRAINLASPSAATDGTNKAYVDNLVAGLSYKDEVKAATTTALPAVTYSNGSSGVGATLTGNSNGAFSAVDGEATPTQGDRYLIKDQANQVHNGIYVLTTVGSGGAPFVLTRATDADSTAELNRATVYVINGSVNEGREYNQNVANPVLGTDNINFVQKSTGVSYTAGDALSLTGTDFDVVVDNSTIEISGDALQVKDGGITAAKLSFDPATQTELDAHLNDTTDAHDASAISYAGGTGMSATDVEAAIDELATEKANAAVTLTASSGLTGGGDLSANRSFAIDTSVVARKYATNIGDASATSFNVDHNLGTLDVTVQVFRNSDGATVLTDVTRTTTNRVVVVFPSAPSSNQYRVLVTG